MNLEAILKITTLLGWPLLVTPLLMFLVIKYIGNPSETCYKKIILTSVIIAISLFILSTISWIGAALRLLISVSLIVYVIKLMLKKHFRQKCT